MEASLFEIWKACKADNPGKMVLVSIGDFYETYNEDAVRLHNILGYTTCKRSGFTSCSFPNTRWNEVSRKMKENKVGILVLEKMDEGNQVSVKSTENQEENKMEGKYINLNLLKHVCNDSKNFYWFNDETKALEQVSIEEIIFDFEKGYIIYKLKHGDEIRAVVAKNDFESDFTLKLYRDEDKYKQQQAILPCSEISIFRLLLALKGCFNHTRNQYGHESIYSYTLKDGQVVEVNMIDCVDELTIDKNGQYSLQFKDEEPDFNHLYTSKNTLFMFEKVKVVDHDGTERFTQAPMAALRLDDKQKELLDKFVEARKALKDAGVSLVRHTYEDEFYAINTSEFGQCYTAEPCETAEDYLNEGVLRIDSLPRFMKIDVEEDLQFDSDCRSILCHLDKNKK